MIKPVSLERLLADPDGALKAAREAGPVMETEIGPMVVSHDGVRALGQSDKLRPAFTNVLEQFGVHSGTFYDFMSISPLDMEGEQHKVWRQLMARTFTPRSVERLRPFLKAEAQRLTAALLPLGKCDFIESFARQLPSLGLCELIGVPSEDRERFGRWADTIGLGFNVMMMSANIAAIDAALQQLLDFSGALVRARRAAPKDDLVTRIAQAVDEDAGLDEEMIRASVAGLVFAGHETTKNQLGWMLFVLSEVPEEWDRVAVEPERARDVIEEVLRFRSTATNFGRMALEDVEIAGHKLPAGSSVMASLWSANRDKNEFAQPDIFSVDANRGGVQIAFGQGAHHCLGAALARAELQEGLIALTRAMHCPKIEPGATFLPPIGINGPTYLPISFTAR
jgi:hypothetical protein